MQYEEVKDTIDPLAMLAVQIGQKLETVNNKMEVVDPGRIVAMTKAGYEAMEKNEDGTTRLVPDAKVLGFADHVKQGKITVMKVVPFEDEEEKEAKELEKLLKAEAEKAAKAEAKKLADEAKKLAAEAKKQADADAKKATEVVE